MPSMQLIVNARIVYLFRLAGCFEQIYSVLHGTFNRIERITAQRICVYTDVARLMGDNYEQILEYPAL